MTEVQEAVGLFFYYFNYFSPTPVYFTLILLERLSALPICDFSEDLYKVCRRGPQQKYIWHTKHKQMHIVTT